MMSPADIKKKADRGYKIRGQVLDYGLKLTTKEIFEKFMESYSVYYNVIRNDSSSGNGSISGTDAESGSADFDAEAVFDSKGEQYFLIKAAKVAEMNTAEYVYFKRINKLKAEVLTGLDLKAWEAGIRTQC